MTPRRLRLLYLNYALPPGASGRFPTIRTAAHVTETRMAQALAKLADVSPVGLMPHELFGHLEPRDDSSGLDHDLLLWQRKPEFWNHWQLWRQLQRFYLEKVHREGLPDAVLVWNFTPVFNRFIQWLHRQRPRPLLVLVLADSSLGRPVSFFRRLRYAFKPVQVLEEQAALWYDACLGFGIETKRHFEARGVPWQWMPSAFNFYYEPPPTETFEGPIRFGYFGGLTQDIGVLSMVRAFLASGVPGPLRVCGFGALTDALKQLAREQPKLLFDGLLPRQSDCLPWAQQVDVLVNPRLPLQGRDNSFPSKIFEFGMTGRAILSTRTGGVDEVLGGEGVYVDTDNFEDQLRRKFCEVAAMPRAELLRRGTAIRQRILDEFNWDAQARRVVEFLNKILTISPKG